MKLTNYSRGPYICLFCRIHCTQTTVSSRQSFSLLSTSSSEEHAPPPPPSPDSPETNFSSLPSTSTHISRSTNDSVASSKGFARDSSSGNLRWEPTIIRQVKELQVRKIGQTRQKTTAARRDRRAKVKGENVSRKDGSTLPKKARGGGNPRTIPQIASTIVVKQSGFPGLSAFRRVVKLLLIGIGEKHTKTGPLREVLCEEFGIPKRVHAPAKTVRGANLAKLQRLQQRWELEKVSAVDARLTVLENILTTDDINNTEEHILCKELVDRGLSRKSSAASMPSNQGVDSSSKQASKRHEQVEVGEHLDSSSSTVLLEKAHARSGDETSDDLQSTKSSEKAPEAITVEEMQGKSTSDSDRTIPISADTDSQAQQAAPQAAESGSLSASIKRQSIDAGALELIRIKTEQPLIPSLTHDLQRVLFNPGVYQLQDPRSRVYNFDPYLKSIMPVTEFDFSALRDYIISSKDDTLRQLGIELGRKYLGSSSNMTSVLSHFHYLLSSWREINTSMLTRSFPEKQISFVQTQRAPAAVFLRHKDGIYGIDADKEFDSQNILTGLGRSMEKLLTSTKDRFELYRRSSSEKLPDDERNQREAYHYSQLGDFLMRSQLDAKDSRLPGTGVFDLKTRAVISIRMDARHYQNGVGYQIRDRFGQFESYEREFYDMIRSAFLKYSLQVRMGNMDGVFVAYHNVESLFGFQYISLPEMDAAIHGQSDLTLGDREFNLSLKLWNQVLDRVTSKFPGRSLRMHFETRESRVRPFMYVFAEPVDENKIQRIQESKAEAWEQFIERIHKSTAAEPSGEGQETDLSKLPSTAADSSFLDELSKVKESSEGTQAPTQDEDSSKNPSPPELCCLLLTVQNRINQAPVTRPVNITASDAWTLDFDMTEVNDKRTHQLYDACKKRRRALLDSDLRGDISARGFTERLRELTQKGRMWKQQQSELDALQKTEILYNVE